MQSLNIIVLSNQFFDSPLKTNKWHVSTRLSALGHNVLFIDPPTRFKLIAKLFNGKISLFKLFSFVRGEGENLRVFSPLNLFNFPPFSTFNIFWQARIINAFLKKNLGRKSVLWVYHFDYPSLSKLLSKVSHEMLIYDAVDDYESFPEYLTGASLNKGFVASIERLDKILRVKFEQKGKTGIDWVRYMEEFLARRADLVFVSAPGLLTKFQKIINEDADKVHFLPNSGDYERFKNAKLLESHKILKEIPGKIALFTGAIDSYKVNISLLAKAASSIPELTFVVVGPTRVSDPDLDLTSLAELRNVKLAGLYPYEEMPAFFAGASVYLIPYVVNSYTVGGCFPVKFHDALAAGLPTVVTNLPAYQPFKEVCYISGSDDEFIENIRKAIIEDSPQKKQERQTVASQNTWEGKVKRQLELIGTIFKNENKQ